PPPAPPKKEEPKAERASGFEPLIAMVDRYGQPLRQEFWTLKPLGALGGQAVGVPIDTPREAPKAGTWRALLEIGPPGGGKRLVLRGREGFQRQTIQIPLSEFRRYAARSRQGGVTEYNLTVRTGAAI